MLSLSLGSQHDTTCICCWAPAPAADIDQLLAHSTGARSCRSISPALRALSSKPPHAAAAIDRWDRQTDRRTRDCYIDPALHTTPAASKTVADWHVITVSVYCDILTQLSNWWQCLCIVTCYKSDASSCTTIYVQLWWPSSSLHKTQASNISQCKT